MRTCDRHTRAGLALLAFAALLWQPWTLIAQAPEPAKAKYAQINQADLKEWLSYLASDTLQGRQVFSEGYGLAAGYIAEHLRAWGVKPAGDDGTYFENVRLRGYRVARSSSVTVTPANGQSRTFKHGDHVTFPATSGGKQTLTFDGAEFVGYGQAADYQGRDVKNKLIVWVPNPTAATGFGRGRGAGVGVTTYGAKAAIGSMSAPAPTAVEQSLAQAQEALQKATEAVQQAQAQFTGRGAAGRGGFGGRGGGRAVLPAADLTSVQRPDSPVPPQFTADETFFEALFAGSNVKFSEITARAAKGEPLTAVSIPTKVTITIDNTFEVVSEQLTRNVVGMVEGSDPTLKNTYVLFGAHLDHIGYSQTGGGGQPTPSACRARSEASQAMVTGAGKPLQNQGRRGGGRGAPAPAPAKPFDERDIISNGADDDGSGSVAMMAIAKAFATGPRPKRSVVFIWHSGEEAGLYGSRYTADYPVVPLESIQVQINMDMVGRDDCDNLEGDYTNTVFVVGADRISTDLHNLIVKTNATMQKPLTLDYELNDPTDPENIYTRSDHYSYAAKGIPIVFFTTGLHQDYHRVTDTVDKIVFPKMTRIAQLVYESGFSIANSERKLERDNKGPRAGLGAKAEVLAK
jgi:Peptidase family M28